MSCKARWRLNSASAPNCQSVAQRMGLEGLRAHLNRFAYDVQGTVMMTFGLMAITMFAIIGGAVDFGRWMNARAQTISAIDAAVLAAGRALQTGASAEQAKQVALSYYNENTKSRLKVDDDTVTFMVSGDRTTVSASGSASIRTPFMGLANINSLPLFATPEAPEASTLQRAEMGINREISLMLDVSGSMCSPCTKRDDMKAAAKDLVSILLPDTPGQFWTKIAVVPFSGDVRPPASMLPQVVPPTTNVAWPTYRSFANGGGGGNSGSGSGSDEDEDDDDAPSFKYYRTACVGERQGSNKHTDAAASPASDFVTPTYVYSPVLPASYTASVASNLCTTPVSGTVLPLTTAKPDLLAMINGLTTGGGTAGHIGTAWAYYMISPNWGSLVPEGSEAVAYGTSNVKKIAILMTDGEYNYTYDRRGIRVGDSNAGSSANGNSSASQAIAICNQMKQDGIEVYTVGFDLGGNQTAINTLKNCASDNDKAYLAENGAALKSVFRDIAIKLTDLHLAK